MRDQRVERGWRCILFWTPKKLCPRNECLTWSAEMSFRVTCPRLVIEHQSFALNTSWAKVIELPLLGNQKLNELFAISIESIDISMKWVMMFLFSPLIPSLFFAMA